MASIQTYLQYETAAGVKYYYEQTTKKTTYDFPKSSIIVDSKTKQIIYTPPGIKAKLANQTESPAQNSVNETNQSLNTKPYISPSPSLPPNLSLSQAVGPKSYQPVYMKNSPNVNLQQQPTISNQLQSQSQSKISNPLQPQMIQNASPAQVPPYPTSQTPQYNLNPILTPPGIIQQQAPLQSPPTIQSIPNSSNSPSTQQMTSSISPFNQQMNTSNSLSTQPMNTSNLPSNQPMNSSNSPTTQQTMNFAIPPQNQQPITSPVPSLNQQQVASTISPNAFQSMRPIQAMNPSFPAKTRYSQQRQQPFPSFNAQQTQAYGQQNLTNFPQMYPSNQAQQFSKPVPQISTKKSLSDLQAYSRYNMPPSQNVKTLTPSSSGDFQTYNANAPTSQNIQNTAQQLTPSLVTSNRIPSPIHLTESIPMMPDFLVPTQAVHDFSPWTINTVDSLKADPDNYVFPPIKLSKDISSFQSDNPFDYPERLQLSFNSSASSFGSSFLDGIDGSTAAADDESSSSRPNSYKANLSLLANDVEIKTPFLVIEMLANTFKVSPHSIKSKTGFIDLLNKYQLSDFAQENFRKPSSTSSVKKGSNPYEEELTFSDKPLQKPLFKKIKSNLKPFCPTISTSILQFIGTIQGYNQIIIAHNLCQFIQPHQELIDETYFQIIKQATNNPNPKWTENCYLLFLIICTLFKPRKSYRLYILSWAAQHLLETNFKMREFFSFAMIRFESRFLRGTYKDEITINLIKTIPSQMDRASTLFDCSIFEIMWFQRKKFPLLPIPIPLAMIVKELIKKNAIKTPNLLDLPSDSEKVDQVSVSLLTDQRVLEQLGVGDLMGLLKNWLLSISDPLISRSTFNNFLHYENPIDYINCMPSAHRDSLKYLIGFLKDILNNDEDNNSTGSKLANIFGPLIVDPTEIVHSQEIYNAIIARSGEFVKGILFSWQTDDIYPLPNELMEIRKEKITAPRASQANINLKIAQSKRNSVCPLKVSPRGLLNPSNSKE